MISENEFLCFAADILEVSDGSLTLETSYGDIPEWDSMTHLRLVMEIKTNYGVEIPFAEVTNIKSLWEFFRRINHESPKKVIAVDFDNTLWDGVVGEDGVNGIRPNAAFLSELKALKERGILLVGLSKNNEADSLAALGSLGILSEADFVTWRIDWKSKADNIIAIAEELNLGLNAFVFIDDNPAERLEMATRCPQVTIAQFPPKLSSYFPEGELTAEDLVKTEQYRAEAKRTQFRKTISCEKLTPEFMFEALGVKLDVHELKQSEVARVSQLSQKANQFNVCTNRYSESDIIELSKRAVVLTVHAGDRFGDHGLISYVITEQNRDHARILDWVMSCRVMGRGIENRVLKVLEEVLSARNIKTILATWNDSGRNEPVKYLFDRFGFTLKTSETAKRTYEKCL